MPTSSEETPVPAPPEPRAAGSRRRALSDARPRLLRILTEGSAIERAVAFSDAVFAIAMTILVLELHTPEVEPAELTAALVGLIPSYLTFVLSFVVVGLIWMSHHRKFSLIRGHTQTLLRLNLVLLLLVASLALPTGVLGRYGDRTVAVVFYAAAACAIGLVMTGIWVYAWRRRLVDPRVDAGVFWFVMAQSLPMPLVFGLSIPVALLFGPHAGEYTWLAAIPLLLAPRLLTTGRNDHTVRTAGQP